MLVSIYEPILKFGAITWTMGNSEESEIQAAEVKFLRSV
jgi:hypothetical protein